jgi:HAE1 family hydrophobic/amphiphilic exporter-1
MTFRFAVVFLVLASFPLVAAGQVRETYHGLLRPEVRSPKLAGPQHLHDHVVDGKLRLSLHDAIVLALENNSGIRVQEAQVETAKFSLLRSFRPFDPQLQAVLQGLRTAYPGFSQIQGAGTFNDLTQSANLRYTQTLQTGTSVVLGLNSLKDSSNSGFYFLNPYYSSSLNLQITQPILRNGWKFPNQAPVIIARTSLQQSRASFQAEVNDALLRTITRYWDVVRALNNLDVARKSQEAAEATYQHDKRALELGALPPLDIYRSESEVASRRVQVIQSEYLLRQAEEGLRFTIGANQDTYTEALDIETTENPEPPAELLTVDTASALQQAIDNRPEMAAWQYALQADDTGIRLAHNQMLPDLELQMSYQGSGVGGNLNFGGVMTRGGLGAALNQLFGFRYPGYGATLTLNLPIKNRAAEADLGTALVARHRDLYSAQQAREQITMDVRNAVHQLEEAKLTVAAGKTALDLARKMLSAEQRKAQLGTENIFFILDAQTRVATAEANLLQAEVDYQTAVATVHSATGSLLQEYHVQIAQLGQ